MTDNTKSDFLRSDEYPRIDHTNNPTPRAQGYLDALDAVEEARLKKEFRSVFEEHTQEAKSSQVGNDKVGQKTPSSTDQNRANIDKVNKDASTNNDGSKRRLTVNDLYRQAKGVGSGWGRDLTHYTDAVGKSISVDDFTNALDEYSRTLREYKNTVVGITKKRGRNAYNALMEFKGRFDDQINFVARYLTPKNISIGGSILVGAIVLTHLANNAEISPNNGSKNDGLSDGNAPMVENRQGGNSIASDSQEVRIDTTQSQISQNSVPKNETNAPADERVGSLKQNESDVVGVQGKLSHFPLFQSKSEKNKRLTQLEQLKSKHTVTQLKKQILDEGLMPTFKSNFYFYSGNQSMDRDKTLVDAILQLNSGIQSYSNLLFDDVEQKTGFKIYSDVRQIERVNGDRKNERLLGIIYANHIYLSPVIPRDESVNVSLGFNDPRGVMKSMVELQQRATFAAGWALRNTDESSFGSPHPKIHGIYQNDSFLDSNDTFLDSNDTYKVKSLSAPIIAEVTEPKDRARSAATDLNNAELRRRGISRALASSAEESELNYQEMVESWKHLQSLTENNQPTVTSDSIGPKPE